MLTLNDGRNELWQWDTNRKLTVDADCSQVHFSNKLLGRSIDVDVVDGVVIIPDVLLQTDKALTVWAFVGTAEDGYTKISKTFKVNRRNKPADYVFTPPEQTTLGQIMERLDDLKENGTGGGGGSGAVALIVTADENMMASHTPAQIKAHVDSGGIVMAKMGNAFGVLSHADSTAVFTMSDVDGNNNAGMLMSATVNADKSISVEALHILPDFVVTVDENYVASHTEGEIIDQVGLGRKVVLDARGARYDYANNNAGKAWFHKFAFSSEGVPVEYWAGVDSKKAVTAEAIAYELPMATEYKLGGIKAVPATEEMTQEVGITADGKLVTKPGSGSGGNVDQMIETVLALDEVCIGRYANGTLDPTHNRAICTRGYIKPFVVSATLTSADYQFAVVVYNNGAYVRTDGWLSSDTVYTFDHDAYQYKMYVAQIDREYVHDLDRCRKSVKLTISAADILESYNALEVKSDTERRNTKNAVEYMMRRNYDISYANAPAPLNLISYVGNNQIVHPKVLYFPDKFGGHKFWMAYTPYPFANERYENPCIAYSDDGYEWTNIPGNPLFDAAGVGFCSDTHLVYVETTGKLEVWYRYAHYGLTPVPEIMYRQTSTDGLNWTEKEVIVNNTSGDYVQYLSPAVIHDGSIYKLWVVNNTENTINYYESGVSAPGETIALDDTMTSGKIQQNGNFSADDTGKYMYTEKIKLNAAKSFQLTAKNVKGNTLHPALRYVTAYDADGNVLSTYSLQSVPEATASAGRTVTMDKSVDSVIITIYDAAAYTDKTIILPAVENSGELAKVRDITLTYQDGETIYNPWHIDVIEDNGKTVLLTMCKSGTEWSLFLATSEDNITFTNPELVMVGNPYGWDNQLYRSSIVNVDGEYRIYYSAQDVKQRHGLGICTSNTLSNFVGKW